MNGSQKNVIYLVLRDYKAQREELLLALVFGKDLPGSNDTNSAASLNGNPVINRQVLLDAGTAVSPRAKEVDFGALVKQRLACEGAGQLHVVVHRNPGQIHRVSAGQRRSSTTSLRNLLLEDGAKSTQFLTREK
jgi:hypothetical protein